MIGNVKQLLSRVLDTRADRFAASLAQLDHESPILAMQSMAEWLGRDSNRELLQQDGITLMNAADDRLRHVADRAMQELVTAANNQARTTLLLRAMFPYLRAVRDGYHESLNREVVHLAKKPATFAMLQTAVTNWLYWTGRYHIVHFLIEPGASRLPWHEIQPTVAYALSHGGGLSAVAADGVTDAVHLQQQLARLVLLARSVSVDLQGRQLLIADRIADSLAEFTRVSTKHSADTPFGHGGNTDNAPTVLSQLPTRAPEGRSGLYYGLEQSLHELVGLEYQIKLNNALPDMLNPDGSLGVAETLIVIKHLKNRWSGKKMRRVSERRAISGNLTVAYEFATIRKQLTQHAPQQQRSAFVRDEAKLEPGEIVDASLNGLGLKLTRHMGWLRVGQLLGIRIESDPVWRIGMVRRSAQAGQREMLAGVQLLGREPEAISLSAKGAMSQAGLVAAAPASDMVQAIYLRPAKGEAQHLLICAGNALDAGRTYRASSARDGVIDLRVIATEDIGADCVIYSAQRADIS
ncbi:MAG: hypothetical protein JO218_06720 [Burkholderiales bacterium]|nr:hypothetical protein [Burkholderiales bacterium]